MSSKKEFIYKSLVVFLAAFSALALQPTVVRAMAINQVVPNLFIITAVSFGLLRGKVFGAAVGMFLGFGQDIFFGTVVGFYALVYFFLGYASGFLYGHFYKEGMLVPVGTMAAADAAYGLAVFFFTFLFRGRTAFGSYLAGVIIPEVVYTAAAGILVYKFYQVLDERMGWNRWDKESE